MAEPNRIDVGARELRILGASFLVVFIGFSGAQQFVTTVTANAGRGVGFNSLILVYLTFMVCSPLGGVFVARYGPKRAMVLAMPMYGVFIVAITSGSAAVMYAASVVLGVAASLLWTGQNIYLIRARGTRALGASAGAFNTLKCLGSSVGVVGIGWLIGVLPYRTAFFIAACFPLAGAALILRLEDVRSDEPVNALRLARRATTSRTAWSVATIWFAPCLVYGLTIGLLPIQIGATLGTPYVGAVSSLVYVMPILLSTVVGRLSDHTGRGATTVAALLIGILGLLALYAAHTAPVLLLGVTLVAISAATLTTMTLALAGDLSTPVNLVSLTSFFWMIQEAGTLSAFILSALVHERMAYLVSMAALIVCLGAALPSLARGLEATRDRLAMDVA